MTISGQHHTPDEPVKAAQLDASIVERRNAGMSFQQIADDLGFSKAYVYRCYQRALRRIAEPAVTEFRAAQLARFAASREVVLDVLHGRHVVVSNGHVVSEIVGTYPEEDDTGARHPRAGDPIYGDALVDDGPVLSAVDRLLKIDDQEAKLLGLYPATKVDATIDGALRYEVVGVPVEDVV